ncbi:radical SAM protein with 4Fe4S-binding SPASM domain [Anaerobacterium chartisolvens]|uniref:Radical SAM protein with 4Fe4S-binding SPASM domain n=1 Tax=Anaerobacterium chartisolvens TaxID=1297424 RepID=A0A369B8I9_9FIRM|nr:SPASM domain-containing protein [Anaerobacterium chartisolvens]RCX17625.1 radical SAM protein with 4Fe4S-binding SPASM domain [Anaerobacterium chartisolvens]
MKTFKKTYIEITNVCNLSCSFCPKTHRPDKFMEPDLFLRILTQLRGRSRHLYFHVLGEPLMHPELGYYLDLCNQYGYAVNITTNGTLIGRLLEQDMLKPSLRQVNFSLHSLEGNSCDSLLLNMEGYLEAIFDFIREARLKTNVQICLRLWNLKEHGSPESNRLLLSKIEKEFSLDFRLQDKITPCKGVKLADGIFLNQAQRFNWPDITDRDINDTGFCYGLREQIAILCNGTVVPCCLDSEGTIALGNICTQSLDEILSGARAKEIYNGFSSRRAVEPLCRKCQYRQRFSIK